MRRIFVALLAGVSLAALTVAHAQAGPLVGAAIAAVAGASFAASPAGTLLAAGINLAIGLALSLAASAFTSKPKSATTGGERQGSNISVRESVSPRRLVYGRTRLGGTIVYTDTVLNQGRLIQVIALCEGEIDAVEVFYLNEDIPQISNSPNPGEIANGNFDGFGRLFSQTGAPTDTAQAYIVSNAEGKWTTDHKLEGVAALYAYWIYDSDGVYKNGLPNISARVRGLKVYDPRTDTTAYSNNAALVIRDYLTRSKEQGGVGLSEDEIDDDNFIAQANICDEVVTTNLGTVPRYTINGIIELDESTTPGDVLDRMLEACGGRIAWTSGKMRLFVGAWRSPTFTLTADMITGPITITTRQSMAAQFNAIKGKYRAETARYETTDFRAITSSTFEDEDGGDRVFRDVSYDFTTDNATAQRLAKMELFRAREPIEVAVPCNLLAYEVSVGDVIEVTLDRYGWNGKTFEVVGWKWSVTDGDTGPVLGVDLTLREASAAAYSWTATEETLLEDNPATTLPAYNDPGEPTSLAVSEELYETSQSAGVKSRAVISWDAAADAFVDTYEIQYKLSSSSTWLNIPAASGTEATLPDLAPGNYNFRVRSVNVVKAKSAYVQISATITGLSAPPSDPASLRIVALNGFGQLIWPRSDSLDVTIGGKVHVHFTPATSSITWENSVEAVPPLPGDSTNVVLPIQAGTYLVRFQDSSGIYSTGFAQIPASQVSAITYSSVASLTEHPGFSGTKTNCATDGSGLSITDTSTLATYLFSGTMDLTTVQNVRVTTAVNATTFASSGTIDDNTALIDTWADFDGPTGGGAVATVYYRQTDDNPAGSPTWTSWKTITVEDARARAFQFKVEFIATDPSWNVRILTLTAVAEQPA